MSAFNSQHSNRQATSDQVRTTIQQSSHIHTKRERRPDPGEFKQERETGLDLNYCAVRNFQQDGKHTAVTGSSSCKSRDRSNRSKQPAHTHTHTNRTVTTLQRHGKKGYQRRNRRTLRRTKQDIRTRSGQGRRQATAAQTAQSYPQERRKQVEA